MRQTVLSFFDESPGVSYDFKRLARQIGPKNKAANKDLFTILEELEASGKIQVLADGSFSSTKKIESLEGVVDHVNPRFAYVNTGGESDVYIRDRDLGSALHGDTVRISLLSKRTGEKPEGRVEEVIKEIVHDLLAGLKCHQTGLHLSSLISKKYIRTFISTRKISVKRKTMIRYYLK